MLQTTLTPELIALPGPEWGDVILFGGLKLLILIFFVLYSIFAFVLIRQVRLMKHTIETEIDPILTLASWGFFTLTILVLLLALFTL